MAFRADGLPFQENGFHSCGCKAFNGRNLIPFIPYKESLPFESAPETGRAFSSFPLYFHREKQKGLPSSLIQTLYSRLLITNN